MPRSRPPYPAEFRARIIELARAGRSPEDLAKEFEPCSHTIRSWLAAAGRWPRRRDAEPACLRP
jgi:transposase